MDELIKFVAKVPLFIGDGVDFPAFGQAHSLE